MVKANFTFNYSIYLYVMCGLWYIIKLFWEKTDLTLCNCGATTLNLKLVVDWCMHQCVTPQKIAEVTLNTFVG